MSNPKSEYVVFYNPEDVCADHADCAKFKEFGSLPEAIAFFVKYRKRGASFYVRSKPTMNLDFFMGEEEEKITTINGR